MLISSQSIYLLDLLPLMVEKSYTEQIIMFSKRFRGGNGSDEVITYLQSIFTKIFSSAGTDDVKNTFFNQTHFLSFESVIYEIILS